MRWYFGGWHKTHSAFCAQTGSRNENKGWEGGNKECPLTYIHKHSNTPIRTQCTFNTLAHSLENIQQILSIHPPHSKNCSCMLVTHSTISFSYYINQSLHAAMYLIGHSYNCTFEKPPTNKYTQKRVYQLCSPHSTSRPEDKKKEKWNKKVGTWALTFFFFTYFVQSVSDASIEFRLSKTWC